MWWTWLATLLLLVAGVLESPVFLLVAIALSAGQSVYLLQKHKSAAPYAVQIRIALTILLVICFPSPWRWLNWLPTVGIVLRLLFDYCMIARLLSLMPWNRTQPISLALVRRTFLTPPSRGNAEHGLPTMAYPVGICELEARIATR